MKEKGERFDSTDEQHSEKDEMLSTYQFVSAIFQSNLLHKRKKQKVSISLKL